MSGEGFSASLIETEEQLEEKLSKPTPEVIEVLSRLDGDLLILGVGGKIGPTLARMATRAITGAGIAKKVIGVSLFFLSGVEKRLKEWDVETVTGDLLDRGFLRRLPDVKNVIFMAGRKFGSTGNEPLTWAMNSYLPGMVAERFPDSRFVVFSTGNVYPLVPVKSGGASESHPVGPIGEYAQSCLGRERIFEYFCLRHKTEAAFLRLNYAVELRYGVLLDIAQKVAARIPVDLAMGYVNVIWQGDVNAAALRAFTLCQNPPKILNLAGPETLSVRRLAERFGELLNEEPIFENSACRVQSYPQAKESDTALLSNAAEYRRLFGSPKITVEEMIQWVAHWILIKGPTLNKPTHFEMRDGKF